MSKYIYSSVFKEDINNLILENNIVENKNENIIDEYEKCKETLKI